MTKQKFRTAYGDQLKVPFYTKGESLTQQHFKDECSIENVIKQHDRTGIIPHVQRGLASYGDYTEVHEYREALDLINNADSAFMELPSEVRKRFNNNAGDFFEFATNPENIDAMREMGLAPSPAPVSPEKETKKTTVESVATDDADD